MIELREDLPHPREIEVVAPRAPFAARLSEHEAVRADVNINGLPILAWEPYLDQYYKENVIGGPGAFMIVAKDFDTFADAILKKMIIEIAMNVPPGRTRTGPTRIGKR